VTEHHVAALEEVSILTQFVSKALFLGGFLWVLYIALEPFVRRRWPHLLISWTRLLSGQWRDPVVGRDVLIGLGAGTGTFASHDC
jgi:hypothetical protein